MQNITFNKIVKNTIEAIRKINKFIYIVLLNNL